MAKGIGPVKLTRADQKILKSYIPTLQGLAAYLGSSYEIVLHSLEDYDHSVIGIINGEHTGRRIGAPITDLALDMLDELSAGGKASTVYFSRNKKGEPLKSTTIAVRGEHDRIIGLICINLYLNTSLCDILDGLTPGTVQAMAARENFAADAKELIVSALEPVRARVMADDSIPERRLLSFLFLPQQVQHTGLRAGTHGLTHQLALLKHQQGGDAHHAELAGQLRLLVHVHLAHLHIGALLGHLVHNGTEHAAGAAPAGPEVQQDRLCALQHLLLKIFLRDRNNCHISTS